MNRPGPGQSEGYGDAGRCVVRGRSPTLGKICKFIICVLITIALQNLAFVKNSVLLVAACLGSEKAGKELAAQTIRDLRERMEKAKDCWRFPR